MIDPSVHLVPGLSSPDIELFDIDVWRFWGQLLHPLHTARATISDRETLIVRIHANVAGFDVTGWGEAAPLEGWGTDRLSTVRFELSRVRDMVLGGATSDVLDVLDSLAAPTARFAFTSALFDAIAHARRRPLRQLFDPGAPNSITVNATIGLHSPARAAELAVAAWADGFRTLKIKVGDDEDMERARQIRSTLPDAVLRLDANGAWDPETARERLKELAPLRIDYVEQPVADREALAEITRLSPIPIAADESCLPLEEARRLVHQRGVDVLVLKPALLGACGETLAVVTSAQKAGMRVVFTSSIDSAVGRATTAQMAAGTLGGDVACGLATDWFARDLRAGEHRVRGGRLYLGSGNGMGLSVHADSLTNSMMDSIS